MDVWDVLRAAKRSWFVTIPLLAGLVVVTVWAGQKVGPEYKATANTILLGPNTQVEKDPLTGANVLTNINPFFQGPDTDRLNRALSLTVSDSAVRLDMKRRGLSDNFTVVPDNRGPLLLVTVTATTREQSIATRDDVLQRLQNELTKRQDSIDASGSNRATLQLLSQSNPTTETGRMKRLLAVSALVVIVLTLAVGVSVDAMRRRRRLRRETNVDDLDAVARELQELWPDHLASGPVTGAGRR
jgi:hypothetical protein